MAKDSLEIRDFQGVSDVVSKEDRPATVMQKLVNLRPHFRLGRAVKRPGYTSKLSSGITTLRAMKEFTNKNNDTILALIDTNTLKESVVTSGSYAAVGSISNDGRTAGSTIDGTNFYPSVVDATLRSGAGVSASTDRPVWYGHIPERDRFNGAETISSGRYLEEQYNVSALDNLTSQPVGGYGNGVFGAVAHVSRATGLGLTESFYALYAAPVYDGYQRGFPQFIHSMRIGNDATSATGSMEIYVYVADVADALKSKRITAIDLFIATSATDVRGQFDSVPAYFLERIDLNNDTDHFLEIAGTVDNATSKVTIADYADWLTFDSLGMFMYNVEDDEYYRITTETVNGTDMEFTVTPAPTNSTSKTIRFINRWRTETISSTDYYVMRTFYDGYYKKLGSEMYDYLNIPTGDSGIPDFRYKFSAWNGNRLLISGRPDDERNISYFSVTDAPDIIPSQNVIRHDFPVKAVASIGQDFLVFGENETDRIRIVSNADAYQDDQFANFGSVGQKSIVKVSDNIIAVMTYKGPYLISNRDTHYIGEHLQDWWLTNLSKAQKEACVAGYNHDYEEIWFSFPTYTDSDYSAGVIMVFDLRGWREQRISPWWFVQTDKAIVAMENSQAQKLIGASTTAVVDFNTAGAETVNTLYKMKLLQSPLPNRKVRWNRVFIDAETSDTITAKVYFDGSASATTLTVNADKNAFIRYLKKTLELEISTSASTNDVEHLGLVLDFDYRKVQ